MQQVVIVIHLMLVLSLIGVVLLQRSEGGGLGIGGGGGGGFMTSRGTANILTRATAILAGLFFATSLLLSILAGFNRAPTSIIRGGQSGPAVPGSPPAEGGLLKQLQQGAPGSQPGAPATPAPSGPAVPQSK
jgi:preprotein translocase subunit SecG